MQVAISATKQKLVSLARKYARDVALVHPTYITRNCGQYQVRITHALPLLQRTYTRTAYGPCLPEGSDSAGVMLVRAGVPSRLVVMASDPTVRGTAGQSDPEISHL